MMELWDGWASELIMYSFAVMFFAFPFFLIFSMLTVRRLRKLAGGSDNLAGVNLFSGSDIIQVYTTLSLSKRWMEKDDPHGIHPFRANRDFLDRNTKVWERVLARWVFFLMSFSILLALIGTLISFGVWVVSLFM